MVHQFRLRTVVLRKHVGDAVPLEFFRRFESRLGDDFGDRAAESADDAVFLDGDDGADRRRQIEQMFRIERFDGREVQHRGGYALRRQLVCRFERDFQRDAGGDQQRTKRDYLARMVDDKVHCMLKAKEYESDYWDGDRRYGYGGYNFRAGYWTPVAQSLIDTYNLKPGSKVLDLGCGKGFLLHELLLLEPELEVVGTDISEHGLSQATDLVKPHVQIHDARGEFKWKDKEFDLVISLTLLHNLRAFDLENCLREIQRIGKSHYVTSESYRNELEQFNLQCWALTCETFFDLDEWLWMFEKTGYTGDYEFIYFE